MRKQRPRVVVELPRVTWLASSRQWGAGGLGAGAWTARRTPSPLKGGDRQRLPGAGGPCPGDWGPAWCQSPESGPLLPGRRVSPSQTQPLPARAISLLHAQRPQAEALRRSVWRPAQRAPGQGRWARSPPGQDLHGRGELLAPHQSS